MIDFYINHQESQWRAVNVYVVGTKKQRSCIPLISRNTAFLFSRFNAILMQLDFFLYNFLTFLIRQFLDY